MEEVILWGISYDKKDFDFVFIATAKIRYTIEYQYYFVSFLVHYGAHLKDIG